MCKRSLFTDRFFVAAAESRLYSANDEMASEWCYSGGDYGKETRWRITPHYECYYEEKYRVECLAGTADAKCLLFGDNFGCVRVSWTGVQKYQRYCVPPYYIFRAHKYSVSCLAVTPDGSSFVSGGEEGLKLWRFEALQHPVNPGTSPENSSDEHEAFVDQEYQAIEHMQQHPIIKFYGGNVTACVVSSDGSRLYSGGDDSTIRVWDMATGEELHILKLHTAGVTSLALSGSLLVSGSEDKTVKLWDINCMQKQKQTKTASGFIITLCFKLIIVSHNDSFDFK